MITQFCNNGTIVIDIDADDLLIGTQVFKLINAIYTRAKLNNNKDNNKDNNNNKDKYDNNNSNKNNKYDNNSDNDIWLLYLNNISFDE